MKKKTLNSKKVKLPVTKAEAVRLTMPDGDPTGGIRS